MTDRPSERWLFVSNEASNSGAPRMLLKIIEGVRAARGEGWSCDILLLRDGPLAADFARYGTVHLLAHRWAKGATLLARLYRRFFDLPWAQPRRLRAWVKGWRSDGISLVYNNTGTNGAVLPILRELGCPLITHVHELAYSLRRFNTPRNLHLTLTKSDHFLAVSRAAAADLAIQGIPAERITVVPNFLSSLPTKLSEAERMALRLRLGLPRDRPVVVGCGHVDWIKGTDLFVAMAEHVMASRSAIRPLFVWIGGESDTAFARDVRERVREKQLQDAIHFSGPVDDAGPLFAASDVVAITSRIESFSMVALEASSWWRPVVGFASAAGVAEFLGGHAELLAAELDPVRLAGMVSNLLGNPNVAQSCGGALRAQVEQRFLAGPRIQSILATVAGLKRGCL